MTATLERPPETPKRSRRLWWILGAVLGVVVLVGAGWVVFFSSLIGVRSVAVRGTHVVTRDDVLRAADVVRGTPLVRLDTGAIERRVERLQVVASADVSTSFPSTVVITVVERTPVGYLGADGRAVLVDRTGAQYRTVADVPPGLPEFVVPTGTRGRDAGRAVATVAAALPADIRTRLASIQALGPSEITLVLRSGKVVRWGSAERSGDKARVLAALLHRGDQQIDVSDPDVPFTR